MLCHVMPCFVTCLSSGREWERGKTIITPPPPERHPRGHVPLPTLLLSDGHPLPFHIAPRLMVWHGPRVTHLRLGPFGDAPGGAAPAQLHPSARGAAGLASRVPGGGAGVGVAAVAAGGHAAAASAAGEPARSGPGVVA